MPPVLRKRVHPPHPQTITIKKKRESKDRTRLRGGRLRAENPAKATIEKSIQTPYQYIPIDGANNEIRILTIVPGKFRDKIRILINVTRLTKDIKPEFEALSYAWGSSRRLGHIYVGEFGNVTLEVTRNLAIALLYLWYEDRPRKLWIDAICS
jgi:hypothetical protein